MKIQKRMGTWFAPLLGALLIRLIGVTLRLEIDDPHGFVVNNRPGPIVFAFWHNRLFMLPYLFVKFRKGRRMVALISRSRDGDMIASIARRFHITAARGSTSKHGSEGMLAMIRMVRDDGLDAGLTPDGPRGPKGVVQPGIFILCQAAEKPVVPIRCDFSRKWELRSWDGFQIPQPFAICRFVVGDPLEVPDHVSPEELSVIADELCKRLGPA
jgi:hypothetical protein